MDQGTPTPAKEKMQGGHAPEINGDQDGKAHVPSIPKKENSGVSTSRRLYKTGMDQLFERERLANMLPIECSFSPVTNRSGDDCDIAGPDIAGKRLYADANQRLEKKKESIEYAQNRVDSDCTFHPSLVAKSDFFLSKEYTTIPANERLYQRAEKMAERRKERQKQQYMRQKNEYTFIPNSPEKRDFSRLPISEEALKAVFQNLDVNENGYLERKEVLRSFLCATLEQRDLSKYVKVKAFGRQFGTTIKQCGGHVSYENFASLFYDISVGVSAKHRRSHRKIRAAEEVCDQLYEKAKKRNREFNESHLYALKRHLRDETPGCTFQPKINNARRLIPKKPDGRKGGKVLPSPKEAELARRQAALEASERLYRASMESLKRKDDKVQEAESTTPANCTFHPKLSPRGKRSNGTQIPWSSSRNEQVPSQDLIHFEALYRNGMAITNKHKNRSAKEGGMHECTFKPKVNKPRRGKKNISEKQYPTRMHRLYESGLMQMEKRDREHSRTAHAFHPKTNHSQEASHYHCATQLTSLERRYDDLNPLNYDAQYKDEPNSKGSLKRMAVPKQINKKHIEKLYASGMKQLRERDVKYYEKTDRLSQDCTFLPLVNHVSPVRNVLIRQFRQKAAPKMNFNDLKIQQVCEVNDEEVKIQSAEVGVQTYVSLAVWNDCAMRIQAVGRGSQSRSRTRFREKQKASRLIQRYSRGFMGRKRVKRLHEKNAAATKIQALARGRHVRRKPRMKEKPLKQGIVLDLNDMLSSIAKIYAARAMPEQIINDLSLPDFIDSILDQDQFADLKESIIFHSKDQVERVKWFGTLTGWVHMEIHQNIITAFRPDAIDVFIDSLLKLVPAEEIERRMSQPVCAVSFNIAAKAMRAILDKLDTNKHHAKAINHMVASLKSHLIPMPGAVGNQGGKKKKKQKVYKSENKLTLAKVKDYIAGMLEKKVKADAIDDKSEGKDRDTLPEFCDDFFVQMFGVKSMAGKKCYELEMGVKNFSKTESRVRWFGTMIGWNTFPHEGLSTPYNEEAIHVYLYVLKNVLPPESIEERLDDEPCVIELDPCLKALAVLFKGEIKTPPVSMLFENLKNSSKKGKKGNEMEIEMDPSFDQIMRAWYSLENPPDAPRDGPPRPPKTGVAPAEANAIDVDFLLDHILRFWYRHFAQFDDEGIPVHKKIAEDDETKEARKAKRREEKELNDKATKIQAQIRGKQQRSRTKKPVKAKAGDQGSSKKGARRKTRVPASPNKKKRAVSPGKTKKNPPPTPPA